ncbi:salivary plasminogen activator beta-like [Scyliorhinus torazame]|uniref:salivary plasminogen activator beta-like n=1 Tax=Scyliorhinus torazame TaxID=75743 RepID=UPI003B594045
MKILLLILLTSFSICIEMTPLSNLLQRRKRHISSKTRICIESPFEIYRRGDTWLRIHRGNVQKCKCRWSAVCYNVRTKECSANNCMNGGRCARPLFSKDYICRCPEGYLGKHCEIDNKSNCIESGKEYSGTRDYTESGAECLKWHSSVVLGRKYNARRSGASELGLGNHNYCRNPDGDKKPWCYVQGSIYWEYCDIPTCQTVVTSKCGQREYKINKIAGGNQATIAFHPWQAALYIIDRRSNDPHFLCGGSLIHPCWVLTAAHCIGTRISHEEYHVLLGIQSTNERTTDDQAFVVEKIISHPQFNDDSFDNDIALLKLKSQSGMCAKESKFVQPICLPSKHLTFPENTQCEVSGYGKEAQFAPFFSKFLKEARVNLISQQKCGSPDYYGNKLTDNMLCAAHPDWEEDSCKGDSGGPLVCENNGQMHLYGITSWGEGCAKKNKPGVYTRVKNYIQWIEENMNV